MFGRVDVARLHSALTTMRNMFVNYTGGSNSRAGTAFVGYSKQTGQANPPRLIPFQFSVNQGLALEFGDGYMRVIFDGAFVTDASLPITGATNANPCVVTITAAGALTPTPVNTSVFATYVPGDQITLAGGTYSVPATLQVTTSLLVALLPNYGFGTGYAPADTVTLAGGTSTTKPIVTIGSTQVMDATIASPGSGGTAGSAVVSGTTGTGTRFQANVTIASGAITAVNSIALSGRYTVNPTTPAAEPVTGGGLSGATLNLAMGPAQISVTNAGVFTANPAGGVLTQFATSGGGTGATFSSAIMGVNAASVVNPGSYTVFPTNPVSQASTTGGGQGAEFNLTNSTVAAFNAGDWLYFSGVGGMTQLNGQTLVVAGVTGSNYSLEDVFGNPIDSTAWGAFTAGGTAARIYTPVSPYAAADLPWLKFTQSADVMSLCLVNQDTSTEYPPYDLTRLSDNNWTFKQLSMQETVAAPGGMSVSATPNPVVASTTYIPSSAYYEYVATSINPIDGSESLPSPIGAVASSVAIELVQGTITLTWPQVPGVNQFNVYKATPVITSSYSSTVPPPVGALFGFAGQAYGTQFVDTNIIPDFSQVPPSHQDPFARGQIIGCTPINGGGGYSVSGPPTASITTATGSGAVIIPIVVGGAVAAYWVQNVGRNYLPTDTVSVSGGGGTGATAALLVGPQSGTYPGVPGYYQERRLYAYTLNNPDTYFASVPGSFTNFDSRIPTIPSDAIQGTPWTLQVNGVQWLIQMPGGVVVFTGLEAWQLTGQGGSSLNPQPLTPANQQAQPQAYNGCSPTVPPIKIDYDIIYVQAKGSDYRDLTYQFFTNIYTGALLTEVSQHLFLNHQIVEHAWCEEPYRLLWSIRDDGVMLSMTYNKPQDVKGWARHDTAGQFKSCCSVTEPPIDALYLATQRTVGSLGMAYLIERMDDRLWTDGPESTWCVDAGLSLAQPAPAATLSISSPSGVGSCSAIEDLIGGENYSTATFATIVDNNGQGPGTGAIFVPTIAGGQITGGALTGGSGYVNPQITFIDPAGSAGGSGASATVALNNQITVSADVGVFSPASVGQVLRVFGGIGTVTAYVDSEHVDVNLTQPIAYGVFNGAVVDAEEGEWTLTEPTTIVTGLYHLVGATVGGLADGTPIPPTIVANDGSVTLTTPASAVTLGLPFVAQSQSIYLDTGEPTIQGQRKKDGMVTVRVENSRGFQVGSNQVDGSTLNPIQIAPPWFQMQPAEDQATPAFAGGAIPLWTGDTRLPVQGGWKKPGQVAVQQLNPLPLNVIAFIPEMLEGDTPSQKYTPPQRGRNG